MSAADAAPKAGCEAAAHATCARPGAAGAACADAVPGSAPAPAGGGGGASGAAGCGAADAAGAIAKAAAACCASGVAAGASSGAAVAPPRRALRLARAAAPAAAGCLPPHTRVCKATDATNSVSSPSLKLRTRPSRSAMGRPPGAPGTRGGGKRVCAFVPWAQISAVNRRDAETRVMAPLRLRNACSKQHISNTRASALRRALQEAPRSTQPPAAALSADRHHARRWQ